MMIQVTVSTFGHVVEAKAQKRYVVDINRVLDRVASTVGYVESGNLRGLPEAKGSMAK